MAEKDKCSHQELTPIAVFVDEEIMKEAYLARVCEQCGTTFLLVGYRPEVE